MEQRIFLIGFMGSGKTRWGRVVADTLHYPYLDLDEEIEGGERRSVSDIFETDGESGFRKLEQQYLHRMIARPNALISTGGGTPCFFDNMAWMKQHGITIYLKCPPAVLFFRLKNDKPRPLLKGLDDDGLMDFIEARMIEREPVYLQADHIVEYTADERSMLQALLSLIL
ncbi:MAG: shikimate kinase [Lewinellaceae bacterium]|nr:shikimate kinase [Lewinellaceae bacterium]